LQYQTEPDVNQNAFPNSTPGPSIILSRLFHEIRICDRPLIGYVEIHTEDSK